LRVVTPGGTAPRADCRGVLQLSTAYTHDRAKAAQPAPRQRKGLEQKCYKLKPRPERVSTSRTRSMCPASRVSSSTDTRTSATSEGAKLRSCSTSRMLTSVLASRLNKLASEPGRSSISMLALHKRPAAASPRSMMRPHRRLRPRLSPPPSGARWRSRFRLHRPARPARPRRARLRNSEHRAVLRPGHLPSSASR
jgi:hypothetical protein